ncbi:MAG: DUF6750 family protein [Pseudomonadota bacterium]
MKNFNGIYRLSAAVTAGVLVGQSTSASASADLGGLTANITTSSTSLPMFISSIAYICGVGLAVAGIFKLKQHVDNPGQTPMKDGVMRLGAGGALLALPFIANAMMQSIDPANAGNAVTVGLTAAPTV